MAVCYFYLHFVGPFGAWALFRQGPKASPTSELISPGLVTTRNEDYPPTSAASAPRGGRPCFLRYRVARATPAALPSQLCKWQSLAHARRPDCGPGTAQQTTICQFPSRREPQKNTVRRYYGTGVTVTPRWRRRQLRYTVVRDA